jgi:hypothetical protein
MRAQDPRSVDARRAATPVGDSDTGAAVLVRLGWMLGGTLTMLISGFSIASTRQWAFGLQDAVFWSGALFAVVLRYWDIRRFHGQTANGDPATMVHFTRYLAMISVMALSGWLAAQSIHL